MIEAWQNLLLSTKDVEEFLYKDDSVEVHIIVKIINDNFYIWETVRAKTFQRGVNCMWTPLSDFKEIMYTRVAAIVDSLMGIKDKQSAKNVLWKYRNGMIQ